MSYLTSQQTRSKTIIYLSVHHLTIHQSSVSLFLKSLIYESFMCDEAEVNENGVAPRFGFVRCHQQVRRTLRQQAEVMFPSSEVYSNHHSWTQTHLYYRNFIHLLLSLGFWVEYWGETIPQGIFTDAIGARIFSGLSVKDILLCTDCPLCQGSCKDLVSKQESLHQNT